MSQSGPTSLTRRDFPNLASVLRTTKAAAQSPEPLDLKSVYIGDPVAVISDLDALATRNLPESYIRQWIMWNTRSRDGSLEDGVSIAATFARVRQHCENLIAAVGQTNP
jgi:hypothetical protein